MQSTAPSTARTPRQRRACGSIARIWSGRVPREKANAYEQFLRERAIPDYTSIPGNLGGIILRRDGEDYTEFTIITFWDSIDSIKAFAGEDYEKAKYYEEDKEYLLEFPEHVKHYKIVECF